LDVFFTTIRAKRAPSGPASELQGVYLERSQRFASIAERGFKDEAALLEHLEQVKVRTRPWLFLADSRGKQLTSGEFAGEFRRAQEDGVQQVYWAVGPADGWSDAALKRADLVLSFGRITLPHELAAVVAAEQLYRAFTILAGHPYHSGH
jgi:23S rRNA (pseudouridine1915-N3)-methyltransferase